LALGSDTAHRHTSNRGASLSEVYATSLKRFVGNGRTVPDTCRSKQLIWQLTVCVAVLLVGFGPHALAASRHDKSTTVPVTQPIPSPTYYDFKGARLGMSLTDWRSLPFPGGVQTVQIQNGANLTYHEEMPRPICSSDATSAGYSGSFHLNDIETQLGVVSCIYMQTDFLGTGLSESNTPIGESYANPVVYYFLDGQLYKISITAQSDLLDDVISGLRAKFGEPASSVNDTTQNKAGATFPHLKRIWTNPVAQIVVETPWSRIDDLNATYTTTEGALRISAARRAAHPDADKM